MNLYLWLAIKLGEGVFLISRVENSHISIFFTNLLNLLLYIFPVVPRLRYRVCGGGGAGDYFAPLASMLVEWVYVVEGWVWSRLIIGCSNITPSIWLVQSKKI